MKYTSEDLMKAMGLQVGDKIRINNKDDIYIIELNEYDEPIIKDEYTKVKFEMTYLINRNVEILPRPKRVGDLICDCQSCANCPLRMIDCFDEFGNDFADMTLYEILDFKNEDNKDQEIYDLLKARLDKEVGE